MEAALWGAPNGYHLSKRIDSFQLYSSLHIWIQTHKHDLPASPHSHLRFAPWMEGRRSSCLDRETTPLLITATRCTSDFHKALWSRRNSGTMKWSTGMWTAAAAIHTTPDQCHLLRSLCADIRLANSSKLLHILTWGEEERCIFPPLLLKKHPKHCMLT